MSENAFAFFEQCCAVDPEKYLQPDENLCVEKLREHFASDENLLSEKTDAVRRFFRMKNNLRTGVVPDLPQLPEEVRHGAKTAENVRRVSEYCVETLDIIRRQTIGGLGTNVFETPECSNCDGFCRVQAAKFLEPFIDFEPSPLIVPCITEESKNLDVFKIVEFHVVSDIHDSNEYSMFQ